ncbi:MAG: lipoate--protein ligase [Clostridia bacterium]|nr:lipoate--protein ligase [Clostridia bacterium]
MKLYINTHTNPYFNLASEEYLLKNAKDDIIMLWRNEASVIIGKNQNAFAEINFDFTNENNIKVVRRLTGGGAVFHDLGNVNFTFISPSGGNLSSGIREGGLDFAHFTAPIISALCSLGIKAELSGRNDIIVHTNDGERKVSGNAQCVLDGTTLHHGTLLFSAELSRLQGALNVDPAKLKSKGIASVRSRVANIRELLGEETQMTDAAAFEAYLAEWLSREFSCTAEDFSEQMENEIDKLVTEKYSTDSWNLHRFGSFEKQRRRRFDFGTVEVFLTVKDGIISDIAIGGDFFGIREISELADLLRNLEYSRTAIESKLREVAISDYINGANSENITDLLCEIDTIA